MPTSTKYSVASSNHIEEDISPASVGIITPCYNAEAFVEEAIASVDDQTFTDWQHILVNDGSTDQTAAILDACADSDPRRHAVHQTNKGQAVANNRTAAQVADAFDYLLFLDADDTLMPQAVERAVAYLDARPQVGVVHWRFEVVDKSGQPLPGHFKNGWHRRYVPTRFGVRVLPDDAAETPLNAILTHCGMIPSCMLIRQSVFARTDGFNDTALLSDGLKDVDLYIQMALEAPIHRLPATLSRYRVHESQVTSDIQQMDRQYEKLLWRWRRIARGKCADNRRLKEALLFAECRKPTSIRLHAAACEWEKGRYKAATRIWTAAVVRYLWSLLPNRVAAPLYLEMRAHIEQQPAYQRATEQSARGA
ncbi:MAG: glycosyltransferase [Longimonas sp.]|uniref:glycosyltransferase n=1 Tax=Longimonas sp. TaxID=2039626 RepID=UPI00334E909D